MATNQMSGVIQHFRRVLEGPGLTDTQLLEDYINRHDEAAFAALVRRHGPMVWGVCRRVLCNHHAAEDAFQATFLVLVRKAASIASRELLANWLYGVAHQTALKARMTATKRIGRERQVAAMSESAVTQQDQWGDLQLLLDEELSRLPSKYRGVIVLCDLEGKTRKEVAQQLGCPEGTVASRLVRARTMLAKRLTRRGVTLSGGALATALSQQAVSAGVPNSVVASTIKAASMKAVATGTISVKVAALTEQVMKAMLLTKLKTALAVLLVLGFVATEITILTCSTAAGREDKQSIAEKVVEPAAKKENAKEIVTAWGKEIGGLQAGLGFRPGQNRAYQHGETVTLVVRVRNVSKEKIDFQYLRHFFIENPPVVVDDKGKPVPLKDGSARGIYKPLDVSLAPGKETELYELELELSNNLGVGVPRDSTLHGTGKFSIQYERILGNSFLTSVAIKFDPILSKLATGKLELEVKKAEKAPDKKGDKKELVTAWGKEIGGLQAGLGFHPGEHRAYQHGETATVIVRVRNVGKEVVEFKYIWAFFFENPPTITDADGKLVQLPKGSAEGRHVPRSINVPPGKEVELFAWRFDLKKHPLLIEPESLVSSPIHGTGKFTVQCERIVGPTSANPDDPNPALTSLLHFFC